MKKLLILILIYSSHCFACQGYHDRYLEDKKTAYKLSQSSGLAAAIGSYFGPFGILISSGITAGTSKLYDDRAEANLRKYNRCVNEQAEQEKRNQEEQSRLRKKREAEEKERNAAENLEQDDL